MDLGPKITLDEGLDLRQVQSTGSVLRINSIYDETEGTELGETDSKTMDIMGKPIQDFKTLEETMVVVDCNGFVKKLILEEGGGLPIDEDCTVFVAFSAYWENESDPFDVMTVRKPLEVNLKDNGILPGLEMAIKTMLVGELSLFILSHEVMYGELGIPPRIKPAAKCAFYIKLLRSILTPKEGKLCLSEPNMFQRVHKEVKLLYSSGAILFQSNMNQAVYYFRKAVAMLHRCRLADEEEEKLQEKLLKKLYINLAICYNKMKQPLKACVACNELNRLNHLWNNGKSLLQNAKALRMIGQYNAAEKRLRRAMKLVPDNKEMQEELKLLKATQDSCNQSILLSEMVHSRNEIHQQIKEKVDELIKNFKENNDLCKLTLPPSLSTEEMEYVRQACIRENLFFNKISRNDAMSMNSPDADLTNNNEPESTKSIEHSFVLDKEESQTESDFQSAQSELTLDEEMFRQIDLMMTKPMIFSTQK